MTAPTCMKYESNFHRYFCFRSKTYKLKAKAVPHSVIYWAVSCKSEMRQKIKINVTLESLLIFN